MKTSLTEDDLREVGGRLRDANAEYAARFPGESGRRQPVHTVYGGAHLFKPDSTQKLGVLALRALDQFAVDWIEFAEAVGLPGSEQLRGMAKDVAHLEARIASDPEGARRSDPNAWLAYTVYTRVREKLGREPVEDFRIDFEDGYGIRPDAEEDAHAVSTAGLVAQAMQANTLPPFFGIRIKPFTEELRTRSMRTLDLFLTALVGHSGGRLPENFVVTFPKIISPDQVTALADLFDRLEPRLGLAEGTLKLELMVETPQSIFDERGRVALPFLVDAARGRCVAAHFGTYDYTASCQITAAHQQMLHPACDFARAVMQVALAGTGVWLSDGATNVMPTPPHRTPDGAEALTEAQIDENRATVHRAWRLHFDHVRHSLVNAFYQGWDLHPAQLPTRYAAVFAFFLEGLEAAGERLSNFVAKAAQATLVGDVFDDAATGQGLLNYFLRAINCGAITEDEARAMTSLTLDELRGRSFLKILENRRG